MYQLACFLAANRTIPPPSSPPHLFFNIGYATEDTHSLNNHRAEVGLALAMVLIFQGPAQCLLILFVRPLLCWLHSQAPYPGSQLDRTFSRARTAPFSLRGAWVCSFLSQHNIPSEKKANYKTKDNYPCLLSRYICQFLFVFSSRWTLQLAYQFSYNILLDFGSIVLNL